MAPDHDLPLEEYHRAGLEITRVGGAAELTPVAVRVTTVFRREDGVWKVVHRHGDAITAPRPAASVIQT